MEYIGVITYNPLILKNLILTSNGTSKLITPIYTDRLGAHRPLRSFLQLTSSTQRAPGPMDRAAAALAAAGRDLEKEDR